MFLRTNKYSQFDSLEIKESIFKEFDLPRHLHDTYCIGLHCQGIKNVNINDRSQIMHSNSVSIINPYQVHADQNIDNSDSHFRMIYFNNGEERDMSKSKPILFSKDNSRIDKKMIPILTGTDASKEN